MRLVIWDDETLQPVTVVNLPVDNEAIERMGRRLRVEVGRPRFTPMDPPLIGDPSDCRIPILEITFEKMRREHRYNGAQECWMAFVTAVELAVLLKPDWLIGQLSAVEYLQQQNDRLTDMLIGQLSTLDW